MRVLIGCECSGVVRNAFRKYGHDAWSCDLEPASDGSPYHLQTNVLDVLTDTWDLGIFHPDCTYLANSGALRLYVDGKKANGPYPPRWAEMRSAARFFRTLLECGIPSIAVENPVMHGHAKVIIGAEPSQSIQPWQFGDDASKRTCLWLRNLPLLKPTDVLRKNRYANQTPSGQNRLGPSPERAAIRAVTYPGVADAMAQQWGAV